MLFAMACAFAADEYYGTQNHVDDVDKDTIVKPTTSRRSLVRRSYVEQHPTVTEARS
jgi:hypothetical protein